MKKLIIAAFLSLIVVAAYVPAYSQIDQLRRSRVRMDASIRAEDEKERKRNEELYGAALPVPRAAVMNVDVQGILSAQDLKSFADARLRTISRITDGENLWLYLKFKTKLGDYVLTTRDADDPTKLHYSLFAEIGPKGDITALNQYLLQFTKEDLAATELKINLAPGLTGRNRSIPLFLTAAGSAKPGLWTNEIRVSNMVAVPRGLSGHLATASVVLDLKGGNAKYRKMDADYDSMVLRGTTDLSIMPIAGTFYDAATRDAVVNRLKAEGLTAESFYFAGDAWSEYMGSTMAMKRERKVFAVYTYKKAADCFYGLAAIVQNYDYSADKFGPSEISLTKDLALPCAK
ncbi:MAG: hypothetical protein ABI791_10105 [Acidobacteriota bacterium]